MNTIDTEMLQDLGTPEAAVRSCVTLLSMLFSQPERYVAYFLDLYFQVRLAYERAREEDGAPQRAAPEVIPDGSLREQEPPTREDVLRAFTETYGKKEEPAPAPADEDPEKAPETSSRSGQNSGYAKYKQRVGAHLAEARAAGHTIAEITRAAGGELYKTDVIAAINAQKISISKWKAIETALQRIDEAAGI